MPITPSGTEYTIRHSIVDVEKQNSGDLRNRICNMMIVYLTNNIEYIEIPCFNCSRFAFTDDYYVHQEERLTAAILNIEDVEIHYPCARKIAKEIVQRCVFKANKADVDGKACLDDVKTTQLVGVAVKIRWENGDEEMKKVKVEALMEMVDAKEADRRGEGWVAEEHWCSVCSKEIERPWFSLTVPACGHVFHEKCLVRWLYESNVCPLCQVELPTED